MTKYPIVRVWWTDTIDGDAGWSDMKTALDWADADATLIREPCVSVGFLIKDGPHFLTLFSCLHGGKTEDGQAARGVKICKRDVLRMEVFGSQEYPIPPEDADACQKGKKRR